MVKRKDAEKDTATLEVVAKPSALQRTLASMAKVKGDMMAHRVPLDRKSLDSTWPCIPAGNLKFEYLLGGPFNSKGQNACPGFPRGRVTNIFGKEHCGKTTIALHAAAQTCAAGGSVLYIDYEHAMDVRYAAKLGVPIDDPSKFGLFQPETLEQGVAMVCISANEGVDLIVLDSVGAALPKAAFEISMEEILKAETKAIGLQARVWSTALPMILGHLKVGNTALLAIAQQRDSITTGPGGAKGSSVQGGNAWKYYSAVRMEMKAIGQIIGKRFDPLTHSMNDKAALGTNVSVRMKKSKVSGTTNFETTVECFPNVGFDPLYTSASIAVDQGIIKKGGAWYTWETCSKGEVRGQGFKSLLANLHNIPGVQEELDMLLRPRMCDPSLGGGEEETEEEVDYSDPDVSVPGKLSAKQIVEAANGMVDGKFTSNEDD